MEKFRYEAQDKSGRMVGGLIEADSIESAEDVLKFNQLTVISIKPYLSFDQKITGFFRSFLGGIGLKQKVVFSRQIAIMVSGGLPLMDSLRHLLEQTPNKALQKTTFDIIKMIEKGKTFSAALSQFPDVFSPIFVSMVRSGEASGKLDKVLNELADQMESEYITRTRIRGAFIYPVIIVMALGGVSFYALFFIIPRIQEMFVSADIALPFITLLLVKISTGLITYWYIAAIILIAGALFLRYYLTTPGGKYFIALVNLHFPVLKSVNTGVYITTFSRTLSLLISGGVPIIKSLSMVSESLGNIILEKELKASIAEVERGAPLSQPLKRIKYFPPLVSSMIAVGEQTGDLDKVLMDVAKIYDNESQSLVKNLTSLIEPLVMLFVGLGVLFFALAVIVPIFQLSSLIT